jgi:hypothetical protein
VTGGFGHGFQKNKFGGGHQLALLDLIHAPENGFAQ